MPHQLRSQVLLRVAIAMLVIATCGLLPASGTITSPRHCRRFCKSSGEEKNR